MLTAFSALLKAQLGASSSSCDQTSFSVIWGTGGGHSRGVSCSTCSGLWPARSRSGRTRPRKAAARRWLRKLRGRTSRRFRAPRLRRSSCRPWSLHARGGVPYRGVGGHLEGRLPLSLVHATFAATGTPEIIYSTVSGCAPAALAGRRGWGHRRTSVLVRWDYKKPHRR